MLSYIKDRFLRRRIEREEKEIKIGFTLTGIILLVLLVNLTYLNIFILRSSSAKPIEPIATVATPTPSPITSAPIPTTTPIPIPTAIQSLDEKTAVSGKTSDYYLNLGSGSNQSTDWVDVAGTLNTYDLGQYEGIKEVHLETTINVPTANGTISVRLFNKTDNYAVWNSERTVLAQSKGDLIISQNLIYDVGPKLYQVQVKSQFGVPAELTQARVHIITQ